MDKNQRNAIRGAEKGKSQADWDELAKRKDAFIARAVPVYAKEPSALWKRDMPTAKKVNDEFRTMYSNWGVAKSDKDKIAIWRVESESLLEQEWQFYTYENKSENHKKMNRMFMELQNMSWERAQAFAPRIIQLFQEEYYIVPLYFDKAQYLQNPKLSGVMVYKFSWGPQFFNFKYLNLAD
jgi:peptide/nickel transport system substrate-binding protein